MAASKKSSIVTVGRRKSATARVFLKAGAGKFEVNGLPVDKYFGRATSQMIVRQPLAVLNVLDKFDIEVNVDGGGPAGQAGAVRHGIARALVASDAAFRGALKSAGYLTRDPREVERKKYGRHKARRRPQYSKR